MPLLPVLLLSVPSACFATSVVSHGSSGAMQPQRRATGSVSMLSASLVAGLTEEEAKVAAWLASKEMGQSHLLEGWESASPEDKSRLLAQVVAMDERYPADAAGLAGLTAYVAHARVLLAEAAANKNPFEGYAVHVPEGERMQIGSEQFRADEVLGMSAIKDAVFVLVAGGKPADEEAAHKSGQPCRSPSSRILRSLPTQGSASASGSTGSRWSCRQRHSPVPHSCRLTSLLYSPCNAKALTRRGRSLL